MADIANQLTNEKFPLERALVQAIRAGIYVVVVALGVIHHLFQKEFFSWEIYRNFYIVSSLGLLLPIMSIPYLNEYYSRRWLVAIGFAVDVILISALLWTNRLNQSIFLFFYLIVIILSGLVFQLRGAFLLALFTSVLSTTVLIFGEEVKSLGFFFMILLNNIAFLSVAWISGFLAEQLELQGLNISDLRKLNQSIVETIPSGLLTVLENGDVIQFNHGAEDIFGEKLAPGMKLQALLPTHTFHNWPQLEKSEVRYTEGNETKILTLKMIPQMFNSQKTFLVVIEDETQVRKLEYAVRQSEKLAAVGQLAAGIAHEIRNPLAGISGSIELLSQHQDDADDKKLSKIILKEIDRLNHLITEFLDFAKPDRPPVDAVNLSQLFEEVMNSVKLYPNLRQDVVQIRDWDPNLFVRGHRDKLKQAFLNMVINSYQAVTEAQDPKVTLRCHADGDRLKVQVSDNGSGMDEKTRQRIFEPFMTTKPKGTGLGLAITHKIIEGHQGRIFVESKKGSGTTMQIDFPILMDHQAS